MTAITMIEGIGIVHQKTLADAGVTSVEGLLAKGASKKGRQALAAASGIGEGVILKWVNAADLFRIKGVSSQYAELLEAAGVDTVVELARRNPENLHQALVETNAEKKLVRQVASTSQVSAWIEQAKSLPRVVEY